MATTYKMLGQTKPSADSLTLNYSGGAAASQTLVRSLVVSNTSAADDQVRVAILSSGSAAISNADYIIYDTTIPAYSTLIVKSGYTLQSGSAIKVYSNNGTSTFTTFGAEIL